MQEKWEPSFAAQRDNALYSDAPLKIVFLPGLLCDERLWAKQIDALGDIAHATVAHLDTADSMAALASSVLEQAPDGAFMLAGMSMGGYVALEIMRQQPKRVLGLALISTTARADAPETTKGRRSLMKLSKQDFDLVIDQMLPKLLHESRLDDADSAGLMRKMAEAAGAETFRRQQEAIIGRADSRPGLHEIACPTLIVCGREDKTTPPEMHTELAQNIPGAHLSVIERCGHLAPLEQAEQVTRELRSWITETHSGYALR
jgi:pimeloyl-ACP methyl ester carboxylesterase